MQVLLPMFASERWLARLAVSDHRFRFVLKGGVLLAALGNRRPTQDADPLALGISNDHATVIRYVNEVASIDLHDGGTFDPETTIARTIRDNDLYLGVRLSMDCSLASARIKLKLDVNFGDPVTPGPATIRLPTLLDGPPIEILGYPIVTVLAEKLCTAVQLGEANTRIRDYVDLYTLTGIYRPDFGRARTALLATAAHRRAALRPLSTTIGQLTATRATAYRAYRTGLATDGDDLPLHLAKVICGRHDLCRSAHPRPSASHLEPGRPAVALTGRGRLQASRLVSAPTRGRGGTSPAQELLNPTQRRVCALGSGICWSPHHETGAEWEAEH